MFSAIETAELDWQQVDGIDVPISKQFGDVYFSKDNGLLETRHVFLNGNDLPSPLLTLKITVCSGGRFLILVDFPDPEAPITNVTDILFSFLLTMI